MNYTPEQIERKKQQNRANYVRRREELLPHYRERQRRRLAMARLGELVMQLPTGARLVHYGGNRWGVVLMHDMTANNRYYDPAEAITNALAQREHNANS
jgi:hypothetical protein